MDVKTQLEKEIEILFEALKDMEVGTEEHTKASNDVTKLLDKYNEMIRNDYDYWNQRETRERECEIKEKQMEDDRKDRRVKNWLTGISIGGGFGLTVWGTLKSFKFEETGSLTTSAGREFIKKLFHFK